MKHRLVILILIALLASACSPVDLNAPMPVFDTGVNPDEWAAVPVGEFYAGQFNDPTITDAYEIMITDVTTSQYAAFLNAALQDGYIKVNDDQIVGSYPGDEFRGVKHEIQINAGDWIFIPLNDPSQRIRFDGTAFSVQQGYENHPMTMVSWFGARGYCEYYGWRLPAETEWEKAARGTDTRPFPWGDDIQRENANYYSSRDPFENMKSFGSRTSPVGFYNGRVYNGYRTLDSASPFGLYDMAGNVWQWVGDIVPGFSDRFMHGGSINTYDMDLRIWVRNSAPPMYYGPAVGFRCARNSQ